MKRIWVISLLGLCFFVPARANQAKNVILMIADGCGYNQLAVANLWHGKPYPFQEFPVRLAMSTYSWDMQQEDSLGYDPERAWSDFLSMLRKATDSAASASAMSTGVKCRNGTLALDPEDFHALYTVVEAAEKIGKSTGVVTNVPWSHATPAAFAAHDFIRSNFEEIAREMIDSSGCEVIMGCGHPYYDMQGKFAFPTDFKDFRYVGGPVEWELLEAGTAGGSVPFRLIQTRAEFKALAQGPTPARVCGTVQIRETLQQLRLPAEIRNSLTPPYSEPFIANLPTLEEMTRAALNVLDNNPQGFFLMIEGGAIDWACHDQQVGRTIEELDDFAASVAAVIEWVEKYGSWNETLLMITADHETGCLIGTCQDSTQTWWPLIDYGPNHMPGAEFFTASHTNMLIPFYAKGSCAEWFTDRAVRTDPVRGAYIDNTDIGKVIFALHEGTHVFRKRNP
ncbi:alkaline phosphatase [candidate division KSB1 bacterium]|nr:MAG: alkaline phosphatase [candidate division KSB1 bacterium]